MRLEHSDSPLKEVLSQVLKTWKDYEGREGEERSDFSSKYVEMGPLCGFKSQIVLSAFEVYELSGWDSICCHLQEGKLRFRVGKWFAQGYTVLIHVCPIWPSQGICKAADMG